MTHPELTWLVGLKSIKMNAFSVMSEMQVPQVVLQRPFLKLFQSEIRKSRVVQGS